MLLNCVESSQIVLWNNKNQSYFSTSKALWVLSSITCLPLQLRGAVCSSSGTWPSSFDFFLWLLDSNHFSLALPGNGLWLNKWSTCQALSLWLLFLLLSPMSVDRWPQAIRQPMCMAVLGTHKLPFWSCYLFLHTSQWVRLDDAPSDCFNSVFLTIYQVWDFGNRQSVTRPRVFPLVWRQYGTAVPSLVSTLPGSQLLKLGLVPSSSQTGQIHFSSEECLWCQRGGLCLCCGSSGHFRAQCPCKMLVPLSPPLTPWPWLSW